MSRLSKNIIYNLFGKGLLLILGFVAVKYIFKQLGEDALGIIYFTAAINGVLCSLFEMGICSTTVREISAHHKLEAKYVEDLIRTFSLFYWALYIIVAVAILLLAPILVEKWIILETMDPATAVRILRIMGVASFLALPKSFYVSLVVGLERMDLSNIIDVAAMGLQQCGTILILAMGGSLLQVVCWYAACYCFGIFAYFVVSANLFSIMALIPGYSLSVIKRNIYYASRMMFVTITGPILTQADKLCLSKLLPIAISGYYGFLYGVVLRGSLLPSAISQAAFPSFSSRFKLGDKIGLMLQYRKLQDLLCFVSVPILAVIPFALLPVFSIVFNAEIARTLLLPATFLCLGFYMNATAAIPYIFSLAVGKPGIGARQQLYQIFFTVPVTISLVYYMGMVGASLSVVFFYLFVYIYTVPRIYSECMAIPARNWFLYMFKIFALISVTYGTAWIIVAFCEAFSPVYLFMAYLLASVAFLTGAFFMISDELRESLLTHLRLQKGAISRMSHS
jgi:O-antigen/teichoic acid export membrane protein